MKGIAMGHAVSQLHRVTTAFKFIAMIKDSLIVLTAGPAQCVVRRRP